MDTAAQMIDQANQNFHNLQFSDAENAFQRALKADSHSVGARIGLARIRMMKSETKEAERLVDEALKLSPQNAEALSLKGVACMQEKKWNEAITRLEAARKANPNLETIYVNLAKSYRKLANLKASEEAARRAIQLNDKNHLSHGELGFVLMKTKRVSAGIEELIQAIRINPLFLRAYILLGRVYQVAGKMDLAIAIYRNGLKRNPLAFRLREELTGAYAFTGDFHSAYREAILIAINRDNYADWLRAGNCAIAIGEFEKAEKAFQKALKKNPASWEAYYNLAELYFAAKLYKKAKENYLMAIERNNKSYKPFNGIGLLLLTVDHNSTAAQKYFLLALELEPDRKEPLLNMALACADLNDFDDARRYAQDAAKVAKPGDGIYEQAERLTRL